MNLKEAYTRVNSTQDNANCSVFLTCSEGKINTQMQPGHEWSEEKGLLQKTQTIAWAMGQQRICLNIFWLLADEKRVKDRSYRAQLLLGKNKWAAQENCSRKSREVYPMVIIEQTGTEVMSEVFSLILTTVQWLASGAASYIPPPYGSMSSWPSSIRLKPSSGGPEGWGPTHPTSSTIPPYSNPGIHSLALN